jgi:hypothetical protein
VGTVARHFELGTIGLGLVKRNLSPSEAITVAGHSATLDPDSMRGEEEHKPGRDAVTKWRATGKAASGVHRV